jgi:long-chain acyl-CoA synthetase
MRRVLFKDIVGAFGGRLEKIISGGAPLNPEMVKNFDAFGIQICEGYGITECSPLISVTPYYAPCPGSVGPAVPCCEARIAPDGCLTDEGFEEGEIQVKGDNVMQGYFKNSEATAATFTEDGYLRTGDLGIIDKQGNIFIKGRSKCMILSPNGQNIYPEEIESKLNSMPHVAESLIVDRGHALVAIVALSQEDQKANREELMQIMEQNREELNKVMPAYSKISKIEIIEEGFEHTPKQSIKRFMYK